MKSLKAHVFICTNGQNKEGKCGNKNSEALRRTLKERCQTESWAKDVRINAAGCLGQCEQGIACVIYPQNQWLLNLKEQSEDFLFQAIKSAVEKHK